MMRDLLVDLLCVVGVALVAFGVGLASLPAGLVVAGLFVFGAAYLVAMGRTHH